MSSRTARSLLWSLLLALAIHPAWAEEGIWTGVGPLAGTGFASVTVHPASPGWIWADLAESGLYRSSDRGSHWVWADWSLIWVGSRVIVADPSLPRSFWAAGRYAFFRTEDGGAHWTEISEEYPLSGPSVESLFVVPGAFYANNSWRLIVSIDGGRVWNPLFTMEWGESGGIEKFAVDPSAPEVLYLSVVRSDAPTLLRRLVTDVSWNTIPSPVPGAVVHDLVATSQGLFAAVEGDSAGLFRSTDQGQTWQALLGGRPDRTFNVASLAVDPRSPRTLYVAGSFLDQAPPRSALWVSRNAGGTWTEAGPPPGGRLLIDSAAGALYAVGGVRLKRSLDGGATWTPVMQVPSTESSVARFHVFPDDPSRQVLTVGGTSYLSSNRGRSWSLLNVPREVKDLDVDPRSPNRRIAVTSSEAFLSRDGGRIWRSTTRSLGYIELLERVDEQTLLAGGAGIYRSSDNGKSWQMVLAGWPKESATGRWVQKIETAPLSAGAGQIYALTFLVHGMELPHGLLVDSPSILWRSSDNGHTWRKAALNLRTFAVDPGSGRLYGVRNRSILASDDGGRNWQEVARTPYRVHDLTIDPADPNTLYVSGAGTWRSRDRGATWTRISEWSPVSLKLHPADPRYLYAHHYAGIFKMKLSALQYLK